MRILCVLIALVSLIGCQAAEQVAGIHQGIVDPTGVKAAVQVGDSRLEARAEMGRPDRMFLSKSGKLDAMVFYREETEAVVVVDHRSDRVLRVHNAAMGWMDQAQLERIEGELLSA